MTGEDADPLVRSMLIHKEWMHSLTVLSWEVAIVYLIARFALSPHGINSILEEQAVSLAALPEAHDPTIVQSLERGVCLHSHPAEVGVVDETI